MQFRTIRTSFLSGVIVTVVLFMAQLSFAAAAAGCDGAGNCYIRAGATGTGSGANWTNAYTGFGTTAGKINPAGMARGVTYWIATGNYGSVTFSTPDSSTSTITIQAPTAANHGPAADWNSAYAGQALFGPSTMSTDYWTFNGQTRGADWKSGYLLKFWNQSDLNGSDIVFSNPVHDISFKYVEFMGTNSGNMGSSAGGDNALTGANPSNLYVGYSFLHHTGNTQFQLNNCSSGCGNNHTYEYNYVYKNHTCCAASHDEAYSLTASNVIIRFNVFNDIVSTGIITNATAVNPPMSNWDIYGNLFFWDADCGSSSSCMLTDGIIAFLGENMSGTLNVYNNTIAHFRPTASNPYCGWGDVNPSIFGHGPGGTVTINVYNNISYDTCPQGMPAGPNNPPPSFTGVLNWDYNSYYGGSSNSGDTSAHKQTIAGDPFVNSTAYTIAGFQLAASAESAMSAGISLASPYNIDMLGVTRGSNGKWDRGALQYPPASSGAPAPPGALTVLSVQ